MSLIEYYGGVEAPNTVGRTQTVLESNILAGKIEETLRFPQNLLIRQIM